MQYLFTDKKTIIFNVQDGVAGLDMETVKQAIATFDTTIRRIAESADNIFAILGMRNLSSFIGEIFVNSLSKASNGFLIKNPHQDGYPDLLVMTEKGKELLEKLADNMQDKSPFSGFATGGLEVKATCGSVPTPAHLQRKGLKKPEIGDQRIKLLTSYEWKAHHRLTNNLIGIVWDFIDKIPVIVGLFSCTELTEDDWGKIVQPKVGGGRTTSVSIMTHAGIVKMYQGWLAVINDKQYIDFFNRVNGSNLIA